MKKLCIKKYRARPVALAAGLTTIAR